jgi:D-serine deaminase-like pyridoxal phosphate-dependent protein
MTTDYPSAVPMDELLNAINLVKSGEFGSNVSTLAHDLWVVQGYAQNALIGAPVSTQSASAVFDECDEELCKVQKVADYLSGPSAQAAIPTEILQLLVSWATQQLLALLSTYLTK